MLFRSTGLFFRQQLELQTAQRLTAWTQKLDPLQPQLFLQRLDDQLRAAQLVFECLDAQRGIEGGGHEKFKYKLKRQQIRVFSARSHKEMFESLRNAGLMPPDSSRTSSCGARLA